jgi:hypothetical protein
MDMRLRNKLMILVVYFLVPFLLIIIYKSNILSYQNIFYLKTNIFIIDLNQNIFSNSKIGE